MIPVTVLGGFLGAGKTTLLNRLLAGAGEKIGVLVNDFGAVGIDARLIEGASDGLVSLRNGCVCCGIGDDLGRALDRLADAEIDRIVIETSGVADPWRVAQAVKLAPGLALESVPLLVDGVRFAADLADPFLADTLARQLARADLALLTKSELDPASALETEAAVRRLRPEARLARLPPELPHAALAALVFGGPAPAPGALAFGGHGFRSWSWRPLGPLARDRLEAALAGLPRSVLRAKGALALGPDASTHLLQLVGPRWSLTPWPGGGAPAIELIGTPEMPSAEWLGAHFAAARHTSIQG